jgi:SRSO17 transposase
VEPIAGRACAEPEQVEAMQDGLLHFVRESPWSDREVRREATRYVTQVMSAREPVTTWILDDTGFLKPGNDSPGVQRQYTGSAGRICNCQVGVSLSITTTTENVPTAFELYLPECWIDDPVRRKRARIPKEIEFRTETDLAIDMIGRAVDDGVPGEVVLVDAAYGRSYDLRETVRMFGLDYAGAVDARTSVWIPDARGHRRGDPVGVRHLGIELGGRTKSLTEGLFGVAPSHISFIPSPCGNPAPPQTPHWGGTVDPTPNRACLVPRQRMCRIV